jgi:hypothetical protein
MVIRLEITTFAASGALTGNTLIGELLGLNPLIYFAHPRNDLVIFCHLATSAYYSVLCVSAQGCEMRRGLYRGTCGLLYSSYRGRADYPAKKASFGTAPDEPGKPHTLCPSGPAGGIRNRGYAGPQ